MDDLRFGAAVRLLRTRRSWRQSDLATRGRVSRVTVSRIERGHLDTLSVATIRRVAAALDMRVDLVGRWRAGELDRLLNAGHSAFHEAVARYFGRQHPAWQLFPEVSFSVYGERGVVDIVAWHPGRRALLIIELKTDLADINELVGAVDRKRRLARTIAAERGWQPDSVSVWVIVAPGRTNRARIAAHEAMLRAAFPADGRSVRRWLADPRAPIAALSQWHITHPGTRTAGLAPVRRVRLRRATPV